MIFIGGISQGQKILDYVKTVICDRCGRYGRFQVVMTYMYFSFFFIPLFKWNRKYYVKMSCCGTVYELDPEVGKILARGGQVDIEARREGEEVEIAVKGRHDPCIVHRAVPVIEAAAALAACTVLGI